jgi:hypothetical protein
MSSRSNFSHRNTAMLVRRFGFVLALLLLASSASAQSQDSVITDGTSGVAKPPAVWRTPQYPTPGNGLLDALAGFWEIKASLWLAGPDRPPVTGEGFGFWRAIFGGRYLEIRDSLSVGGQAFQTLGYMSWEEAEQHLQLELFLNAGAGHLTATGGADSAWHDFTFAAGAPHPARLVQHWIDGNHRRLEVFVQTPKGREYKLVDADYRRSYGH